MNRLVLLRHGESIWNLENRFTGWTNVELSSGGIEEAKEAGRKLKETDNISEILKTHKYSFKFYPDNDDFNQTIEFEVDIKKITTKTEII